MPAVARCLWFHVSSLCKKGGLGAITTAAASEISKMLVFEVSQISVITVERILNEQLTTHIRSKHQAVSLPQTVLSSYSREEKVPRQMLALCETVISDTQCLSCYL